MDSAEKNSQDEALEAQTLAGSFKGLPPDLDIFAESSASQFASELLTSLGHPTRLRIVGLLRKQPMTVGQISSNLNVSQANVSQHLAVLTRAGALVRASDGATRRYSLRSTNIGKILDMVEAFRQAHSEDLASEAAG